MSEPPPRPVAGGPVPHVPAPARRTSLVPPTPRATARRPRSSRIGAAFALAAVLGTLLLAAVPGPRASAAAADGIRLLIESITPTTPTAGSTLQVRGQVVNDSGAAVSDVSVRLRVSTTPVHSRSELDMVASGKDKREGYAVPGSRVDVAASLAPGASAPFALAVPLDPLRLGDFGVYPMAVEARGDAGQGTGSLAFVQSFLPWVPNPKAFSPSRISWLWPLLVQPVRDASGEVTDRSIIDSLADGGRLRRLVAESDAGPVTWVVDPDLLELTAALASQSSSTPTPGPTPPQTPTPSTSPSVGAEPLPTVVVPTPAPGGSTTGGGATSPAPAPNAATTAPPPAAGGAGAAASLGAASTGTATTGSASTSPEAAATGPEPGGAPSPAAPATGADATPPPGPGDGGPGATPTDSAAPDEPKDPAVRVAREWLNAFRAASTGDQVVAVPYADPDLVAVHHAGLDQDLDATLRRAREVTDTVLDRPVTTDVSWPAAGLLDQSTADTLTRLGQRAVILAPEARPTVRVPVFTPNGRVEVATASGSLAGLVDDGTLSSLVAERPSTISGQTLLVQRFLAETALITAERPSDGRTVLVAPPRTWNPPPGLAERLLAATTESAWMQAVPLSQLRALPPDTRIDRRQLTYPRAAARAELPAAHLARVAELERQVEVFGEILSQPDALLTSYVSALHRLESTQWRGAPRPLNRLTDRVDTAVQKLRDSVELVTTSVRLAGKSGIFPVTVVNHLDQQVTVQVSLSPRIPRLQVARSATVTIGAQRREQVNVPVQAIASGLVIVDARIETPTGKPLGPGVPIRVQITQIGAVTLVITVVAASVLFLAAGVRVTRRALSARRGREGQS